LLNLLKQYVGTNSEALLAAIATKKSCISISFGKYLKIWFQYKLMRCVKNTHLISLFKKSCLLCFAVADDSEDEEEELGGLFRVSRPQKSKKFQANALDCSRFNPDTPHNWDLEEVRLFLSSCSY